MYEIFSHTADVGLRIRADSREQLLAEAARGLFALIVANPSEVRLVEERRFSVPGKDIDYLLFDWLSELLYTFETERLLFAEFDVRLSEAGLLATARGELIDADRHALEHEVKAITYHELKVEPEGEGWIAEVIVDI